jgi:AraC-like DNA-binding protein
MGCDSTAIRRLPSLRDRNLEDPDARFPESVLRDAWRLASAASADEALGLHLALSIPRGSLDLVEYAFRASETLGAALARFARYGRLVNDRLGTRLLGEEGERRFVVGQIGSAPADRHRAELALAFVLRLARETTGSDVVPVEVCFAHAAPASDFDHRRFFRAPLQFAAGVNAIAFAAADAARPLCSADPALAALVKRRLEAALARGAVPPSGTSVAGRVRQLLAEQVGSSEPTAAGVARALGMSERTLSRRLDAEGTSFRELLDRLRGETAAALLRDPTLPIAEIAFFLGYSEPAAFHRSFKRWTGRTPLAYRRERPHA